MEAFAKTPEAGASLAAAAPHLEFISRSLVAPADRPAWEAWVRRVLGPVAGRLGWSPSEDESVETREARAAVVNVLGRIGRDPDVLRRAREIVVADLEGTRAPHPSLASAVYQVAAFAGDEALYERIRRAIPSSSSPVDYYRRQEALTAFTDPALVDRTFDYALSEDVRNQDAPTVLAKLLANPAAEQRVWASIKRRWPEVVKKSDIAHGALRVVRALQLCDEGAAEDVQQFFAEHPAPGAAAAVRRTVERIRACAAAREGQQPRLTAALAAP